MMINNENDVREFLDVLDSCMSDVWLVTPEGEHLNLKEDEGLVKGLAKLENDTCGEMELFSTCREDDVLLVEYYLRKCA